MILPPTVIAKLGFGGMDKLWYLDRLVVLCIIAMMEL